MKITLTDLPEVVIIETDKYYDERGFFLENYRRNLYNEKLKADFVQDNISVSKQHVLRGLHYQLKSPQAKLITVNYGDILDVAVDIRQHSKTFGQSVAVQLTAKDYKQLFIPEGFAHGFIVLSEQAEVSYKCSDYYDPSDEHGIIWNDPELKIDWQVVNPIISNKDSLLPTLASIDKSCLPE